MSPLEDDFLGVRSATTFILRGASFDGRILIPLPPIQGDLKALLVLVSPQHFELLLIHSQLHSQSQIKVTSQCNPGQIGRSARDD
jgi:hypothetical protein